VKWRLFNLLAAISLLICVATGALWVRTFWRSDRFQLGDHQRILTTNHRIIIIYSSRPYSTRVPFVSGPASYKVSQAFGPFWGFIGRPPGGEPRYGALGFFYASATLNPQLPSQFTYIVIPFWFIFALFAVLPIVWLKRRRGGYAPRLCPTCGYDLRAAPERCPECGTVCEAQSASS